MLYTLKLGDIVTTIPTIGFNVETIETKDMTLVSWDMGARVKARCDDGGDRPKEYGSRHDGDTST